MDASLFKIWFCLCRQKYAGYLAVHLKSTHGVEIQVKNLKFKDFEMFKSFLEKTEEETCSNYSTRRIERDSNQQVITANYICSRRGTIPANRSERKRAAKSIKTIKIGNICPSQISLTRIKDGTYTAKWTTTHVGHELDMKFCRLPNKHKELIAHYLKIGLQPSVIKKKMRNLLDNSDKITMAQMVTTKYLNNIKKQLNIMMMNGHIVEKHTESCEMITEFEDETNPLDILDPTMSISNEGK